MPPKTFGPWLSSSHEDGAGPASDNLESCQYGEVTILARFNGVFLDILVFTFLTVQPGISQTKGSAENGKAASTSKTDSKNAVTSKKEAAAETAAKAAPLTPEVPHRIVTEIRSRYNVPPQVSISLSEPKAGATTGYDDLVVSFTGGTNTTHHDFLISTDRKTLAHLEKMDISQDIMSKIDVKGRPVKGNPNAKVTIINFDDFQCPFCSRMHSTLFENVFK